MSVRDRPRAGPPRSTGAGRRVERAALTLVVFAIVGPLAGAVVAIIGIIFFGFRPMPADQASAAGISMIFVGFAAAYPVGLAPSLAAGAAVAVIDFIWRDTLFALALLVGVAAGVVWGFFLGVGARLPGIGYVIAAGCIVATVICWWITRRFRRMA